MVHAHTRTFRNIAPKHTMNTYGKLCLSSKLGKAKIKFVKFAPKSSKIGVIRLNHELDIIHEVCDGDACGCDGKDVAIAKVELNIIGIDLRDNTIGGV